MRNRYLLPFLFIFLVCSQFIYLAQADTMPTTTTFSLQFPEDSALQFQDLDHEAFVLFTVQNGDLNGTAIATVTDEYGTITITPSTSGLVFVTCTIAQVWITLNGLTLTAPFQFLAGSSYTVRWTWTATPVLPAPIPDWLLGGDISLLLTYLMAGDYLGFIMACYTTRIGQLAYVLVILMFTIPLALRTQSVTYVAIVWMILGVIFQTAVPLIGPATVILEILGIGALLFRLFARE